MAMKCIWNSFQCLPPSADKMGAGIAIGPNSNHFLIKSENNRPTFLFSVMSGSPALSSWKGANIQVNFDVRYRIENDGVDPIDQEFCSVACLSDRNDLSEAFVRVLADLGKHVLPDDTDTDLNQQLQDISDLFQKPITTNTENIIGTWGELYFLLWTNDPQASITAWHETSTDRHDFVYPRLAVEVKTTVGDSRRHHFNLNQLISESGRSICVATLMIRESLSGETLSDLVDKISSALDSHTRRLFFSKVLATVGTDLHSEMRYVIDNENLSVRIFRAEDVPQPTLTPQAAPFCSQIHFVSDLNLVDTTVTRDTFIEMIRDLR